MKRCCPRTGLACCTLLLSFTFLNAATTARAQVVPGTGTLINSDDFEDEAWGYTPNWPKSSKEEDEQVRYPLGQSNNGRWFESPERGNPDVVKRTETPPGGLEGSKGALYLRTVQSGVPNHPGYKQAQDDFILAAKPMGIGYSPNCVVRVYLPEWENWEQRAGVSFGIRMGLQAQVTEVDKSGKKWWKRNRMVTKMEPFYPGMFIVLHPKGQPGVEETHASVLIRSDSMGRDVGGPKLTQPGWYTFGMSVTPDARVHYYVRQGVGDLTARDYIYSSIPYDMRAQYFNTIFFNVVTSDNGTTWSTPWILDDPKVFYAAGAPQQFATASEPGLH